VERFLKKEMARRKRGKGFKSGIERHPRKVGLKKWGLGEPSARGKVVQLVRGEIRRVERGIPGGSAKNILLTWQGAKKGGG